MGIKNYTDEEPWRENNSKFLNPLRTQSHKKIFC